MKKRNTSNVLACIPISIPTVTASGSRLPTKKRMRKMHHLQ